MEVSWRKLHCETVVTHVPTSITGEVEENKN